jgi:hypothetical protein
MQSRAIPAFLLPLCLAACATPANHGPRYIYHIGAVGCSSSPKDGNILLLEDRQAEGVFRVTNLTASDVRFYYDAESSFGDYQMFFVRFRDRDGNAVPRKNGIGCEYFSPKLLWSSFSHEGQKPKRKNFTIHAGESHDIKRDLSDFFRWWREPKTAVGPCQVQVRLFGYSDPWSWQGMAAVSEWQPSPCPGE